MHEHSHHRDDIVVSVAGRKAVRVSTAALFTGNAGSYRLRFALNPYDPAWERLSLAATFKATTHKGAITSAVAAVGPDCRAKIPEKVLRERAHKLEVGLQGYTGKRLEVSTNLVNLGGVAHGAGGDAYFAGNDWHGDTPPPFGLPPSGRGGPYGENPHAEPEGVWRAVMAKFAEFEPFMRKMLRFLDIFGRRVGVDGDGGPTWNGGPWPGGGDGFAADFADDPDIDALFEPGAGGGTPGGEDPGGDGQPCGCGLHMEFAGDGDIDSLF